MEGKISNIDTEVCRHYENSELDNLERPYFGYRDTDAIMAEMRAAYEKITDEDHQRHEEEAGIVWNSVII